MTDRTIHVLSPDDFTRCPTCGRRVDPNDAEVGRDEDGPIYEAECTEHGKFLWQVQDDEQEEE